MTHYALVPVEATEEMEIAALTALASYRQRIADELKAAGFEKIAPVAMAFCGSADFDAVYPVAIAASPGGGRVTAEMVEKAAEALYLTEPLRHGDNVIPWINVGGFVRNRYCYRAAVTLRATGLQVEGDGQEGEGK